MSYSFFNDIEDKLKYFTIYDNDVSIHNLFETLWVDSRQERTITKADIMYKVTEYCLDSLLAILQSDNNEPTDKYDAQIILVLNEHNCIEKDSVESKIMDIYKSREVKSKYFTCKTIDEFISFIKWANVNNNYKPMEYIIERQYHKILEILQLETNKPSKHDLYIINDIQLINDKSTTSKKILEIYKNRKINQ